MRLGFRFGARKCVMSQLSEVSLFMNKIVLRSSSNYQGTHNGKKYMINDSPHFFHLLWQCADLRGWVGVMFAMIAWKRYSRGAQMFAITHIVNTKFAKRVYCQFTESDRRLAWLIYFLNWKVKFVEGKTLSGWT